MLARHRRHRSITPPRSNLSHSLSRAAEATLMLGFQELQEAKDFRGELIILVENFGRVSQGYPGEEDEVVSGPQGCASPPGETTLV